VPRLPRVKTERLPEGLHGNTVLSAVSIVIFYAIIQQAVYGPDDAASRKMPCLCAQISQFSSPHTRRAAIRPRPQIGGSGMCRLVSALLNATFSVVSQTRVIGGAG
jgi:hypothetical protein